ncbi:MAG: DUF397 domain-containing protein [Kibdelosporangium sp.]
MDRESWRKSSFSAPDGGECVEVYHDLGAVRDSKNPDGPVLTADISRLVQALRGAL